MSAKKDQDGKIADLIRKAIQSGTKVQDLPLPKELLQIPLQYAKGTKEEIVKQLQGQVKEYLRKIDLGQEFAKILENFDVEIQSTVRFKKKKKKDRNAEEREGS